MASNQKTELDSLKQSGAVTNSPFFSSLSKATSGSGTIRKSNTHNKNPFLDQDVIQPELVYGIKNSKTSSIDIKNSSVGMVVFKNE